MPRLFILVDTQHNFCTLLENPTRDAINYAWGYSQKYGAITCNLLVTILLIHAIGMWKNYRVDKAQNKGTLL